MSTISAPGTTIYIQQIGGGDIQYNFNNSTTWNNITTWPVTLNTTDPTHGLTNFLNIHLNTNLTINATTEYFIVGIGSIIFKGNYNKITVGEFYNYPGFIQNGTSTTNGFNGVIIENIIIDNIVQLQTVTIDISLNNLNSQTQQQSINYPLIAGAGWLCQEYFAKGAINNLIGNCCSYGQITNNNNGGLVGKYAGSHSGNISMTNCVSLIDEISGSGAGGIFGSYAGANSGNITVSNCHSIGNITSIDSGGIFGSHTGNASSGSIIFVQKTYSTGIISGTNSGGIFGNNTISGIISIDNCYFNGTALQITGNGTSGIFLLESHIYPYNQNWSDSSAISSLSETPSTIPGNGMSWIATAINTPFFLTSPLIASFTPNEGSRFGGETVLIDGTDFNVVTSITFNDTNAISYDVIDSSQISVVIPISSTNGLATVIVNTIFGAIVNSTLFTYITPLTIFTVYPPTGSVNGNTHVTITGIQFNNVISIKFNNVESPSYFVFDSTTISAITPPGTAGLATVSITTATETTTNSTLFTYMNLPVISSVTPSSGSISGYTIIIINGENFLGLQSIQMNGVTVNNYTLNSSTQLRVTTPPNSQGYATIAITTQYGTTTNNTLYQYIDPTPPPVPPPPKPNPNPIPIPIYEDMNLQLNTVTASQANLSYNGITTINPAIHYGEVAYIIATGFYTLSVSPGDSVVNIFESGYTYTIEVNPIETTIYYLSGINTQNENITVNVTIYVKVTAVNQTVTTDYNTPVNLSVVGSISYKWYPSLYLNQTFGPNVTSTPLENMRYIIQGTDQFNTVSRTFIDVIVNTYLVFSPNEPSVYDGNILKLSVTYTKGNNQVQYRWRSATFDGLPPQCIDYKYGNQIILHPYKSDVYYVDVIYLGNIISAGKIPINVIQKPSNIIDVDILPYKIYLYVLNRNKKALIDELKKDKGLSEKIISFYYTTLQTAYRMEWTDKNGISFKVKWNTLYQVLNDSNAMILNYEQQWQFFQFINKFPTSNFKYLLNTVNEIYLEKPQKIYITPLGY